MLDPAARGHPVNAGRTKGEPVAEKPRTAASAATVFVLFGATGDLASRMVLPAFFDLARRGLLPEPWRLVGNGRGDVSHEDFAQRVHDTLAEFGPHPDEGRGRSSPVGCGSPAAGSTRTTRAACSTSWRRHETTSAPTRSTCTISPFHPRRSAASPWAWR